MKPLLNLGGWQEEKTTAHVKVNVRCIFKFFASAEPWGGSRRGGGGGKSRGLGQFVQIRLI